MTTTLPPLPTEPTEPTEPTKPAEPAQAVKPAAAAEQPRNALHGITLEALLTALVARYGWPGLAQRIPLRCFSSEPSLRSSLTFLRRTPWARDKVESLYLFMLRELRREGKADPPARR